MRSGYRIHWSDTAANDLQRIIEYLQYKWTDKEIENLTVGLN